MPTSESSRTSGPGNENAAAPLPTLPFSDWLKAIDESKRSGSGIAVECGECRGCCTSSYFIPIGPDEKETLARVPKRLLFPAPGKPKGRRLLGYDEKGHCALFKDNACSIYAHRPHACRAYDCRVFAATGFTEADKPAIAEQAGRWRFAFPSEDDERRFGATQAAARFLREHAADFPEGFLPSQATQLAAFALRIHPVFLTKRSGIAETVAEIIRLGPGGKGLASLNPPGRARKRPKRGGGGAGERAGSG